MFKKKENKYTSLYCVSENFCDSFYYGSGSGSGTVINYGSGSDFLARYGSDSASQRVTVPTVPVPQRWFGELGYSWNLHKMCCCAC